jgi:LmbE family N-acetylglucosaminyl deacetylase
MDEPRLLGVFAHPDDEVFCAGGTLAKYVSYGSEAMVVSATRGQGGQIRDAGAATRRTLGQVREGELQQACSILGVQHALCLDYPDGELARVDRVALSEDVLHIASDFRPDVVITFGPEGAYGHPDHIAISEATTEAFRRARVDGPAEGPSRPAPSRLFHSLFPRSRLLLLDRLAEWLVEANTVFKGSGDFVHALSLFAQESTTLRYVSDSIEIEWFPPGVYILEQGEPPKSLYLILSGEVEVTEEGSDGTMRLLNRMGPGQFFGEVGIVHRTARTAHVIAADSVTCLVLSPQERTTYASRGPSVPGQEIWPADAIHGEVAGEITTVIDVSQYVELKIAAAAAHRTQFPIRPDMFPLSLLTEMMGKEYFLRAYPPGEPETELLPGRDGAF